MLVVDAHVLLLRRRTKLLELAVEAVCASLLVMMLATSGIRMNECVLVAAHDMSVLLPNFSLNIFI